MNLENFYSKIFAVIKKAATILSPFDDICPCGCHHCEEGESLILMPAEELYWKYLEMSISEFNISTECFHYLAASDHHCPFYKKYVCLNYDRRPIDCRMFPLYPIFDINNDTVSLGKEDTYCLIAKELKLDFILAVTEVCKLLNENMSLEWKIFYNKMNERSFDKIGKTSISQESSQLIDLKEKLGVKPALLTE